MAAAPCISAEGTGRFPGLARATGLDICRAPPHPGGPPLKHCFSFENRHFEARIWDPAPPRPPRCPPGPPPKKGERRRKKKEERADRNRYTSTRIARTHRTFLLIACVDTPHSDFSLLHCTLFVRSSHFLPLFSPFGILTFLTFETFFCTPCYFFPLTLFKHFLPYLSLFTSLTIFTPVDALLYSFLSLSFKAIFETKFTLFFIFASFFTLSLSASLLPFTSFFTPFLHPSYFRFYTRFTSRFTFSLCSLCAPFVPLCTPFYLLPSTFCLLRQPLSLSLHFTFTLSHVCPFLDLLTCTLVPLYSSLPPLYPLFTPLHPSLPFFTPSLHLFTPLCSSLPLLLPSTPFLPPFSFFSPPCSTHFLTPFLYTFNPPFFHTSHFIFPFSHPFFTPFFTSY